MLPLHGLGRPVHGVHVVLDVPRADASREKAEVVRPYKYKLKWGEWVDGAWLARNGRRGALRRSQDVQEQWNVETFGYSLSAVVTDATAAMGRPVVSISKRFTRPGTVSSGATPNQREPPGPGCATAAAIKEAATIEELRIFFGGAGDVRVV